MAWEGWSWSLASEEWTQEDLANESQQVRKMLQRPLTSVLEMQALDDAAADVERELEQKIDELNAREVKDDRFKSQDSQATLVLGQLTSSESLDDDAGHPRNTPEKLQRRKSSDSQLSRESSYSASQVQDYLDSVYEHSHRRPSRSPRERGLPSELVKEEVAEQLPMPTLATNPQMPPTEQLPMPTLATNPPMPPATTASDQQAVTGPTLALSTMPPATTASDQQAVTALAFSTMPPATTASDQQAVTMPASDQQAVTGQPLDEPVKEEMEGNANPDLECPPARDEDQSWRKDKWGRDLKPAALYARFYRSGRSPMATVGFRVSDNL